MSGKKGVKRLTNEEYTRIKELQDFPTAKVAKLTGRSLGTVKQIFATASFDAYKQERLDYWNDWKVKKGIEPATPKPQQHQLIAEQQPVTEASIMEELQNIQSLLNLQNRILENIEINTRKRGIF